MKPCNRPAIALLSAPRAAYVRLRLQGAVVKPDVHPKYRLVLFRDASTGKEWVSRSTTSTPDKRTIDGVEHSVISLEISSDSHPFYTGRQRLLDTEGRIDRFRRKWAKA